MNNPYTEAIAQIKEAALAFDELYTASLTRSRELQAIIDKKTRYIAELEKQIEPGVLEEIRACLSE